MHCNTSRGLTMIPLGIALLFQALKQFDRVRKSESFVFVLT